jgi:hypothetical protein
LVALAAATSQHHTKPLLKGTKGDTEAPSLSLSRLTVKEAGPLVTTNPAKITRIVMGMKALTMVGKKILSTEETNKVTEENRATTPTVDTALVATMMKATEEDSPRITGTKRADTEGKKAKNTADRNRQDMVVKRRALMEDRRATAIKRTAGMAIKDTVASSRRVAMKGRRFKTTVGGKMTRRTVMGIANFARTTMTRIGLLPMEDRRHTVRTRTPTPAGKKVGMEALATASAMRADPSIKNPPATTHPMAQVVTLPMGLVTTNLLDITPAMGIARSTMTADTTMMITNMAITRRPLGLSDLTLKTLTVTVVRGAVASMITEDEF